MARVESEIIGGLFMAFDDSSMDRFAGVIELFIESVTPSDAEAAVVG